MTLTNSQVFDINGFLKSLAKNVWKNEGLQGTHIQPTLDDLQSLTVATPMSDPHLSVSTDGEEYRLTVWKEGETKILFHGDCPDHIEGAARLEQKVSKKGDTPISVITIKAHMDDTEGDTPKVLFIDHKDIGKFLYSLIGQHLIRTAGEPSLKQVKWLHDVWKEHGHSKGEHPLYPIVREWAKTKSAKHITPEQDRKYPIAVLKHPIGSVRELTFTEKDVGQVFQTPERVEQAQLKLDIGEKSKLPSIMPLEVVQTVNIKTQTRSGAVSHELRLFFEAMMALQPNQYRADLMFRLGDLINYLYPNSKFNWTYQFPHIERALNLLNSNATVPWIDDTGSLRRWRPVSVRSPVSIQEANRDTPIFFDVALPPDAQQGHIVHKEIHRLLGMKSAAKWNAYHVACYLWDKYGTVKGKLIDPTRPVERRNTENRLVDADGRALVNRNGREIKSVYHPEAVKQLDREDNPDTIKRYPVLSTEDLILACFPNGYTAANRREYLSRAKAHWEGLEAEGYIVIHKEGTGWRILPPPSHVNAHRAIRTASRHSREITDF